MPGQRALFSRTIAASCRGSLIDAAAVGRGDRAQIGPAMKHDDSAARAAQPDDRRIPSWSTDRTLRLWDAATGAQIGPAMKHDSGPTARFS